MKEDNDSDEDPWADKTKEISFSTKSPEKKAKSSPHCKLTENNDSKGGGSSAESSDEEDQIKDHLKDSSLSSDKSSDSVFSDSPGSTVKATIESNSKMEIDDDSNNDDGKFFFSFCRIIRNLEISSRGLVLFKILFYTTYYMPEMVFEHTSQNKTLIFNEA